MLTLDGIDLTRSLLHSLTLPATSRLRWPGNTCDREPAPTVNEASSAPCEVNASLPQSFEEAFAQQILADLSPWNSSRKLTLDRLNQHFASASSWCRLQARSAGL